jgi:hypothetical protein
MADTAERYVQGWDAGDAVVAEMALGEMRELHAGQRNWGTSRLLGYGLARLLHVAPC